jgi:hypothetical protein
MSRPDAEIAAAAAARRLRFEQRPQVTTRAGRTESRRDRLPTPARPGVTYRDVSVAIRLASRLRRR